MDRVFRVIGVGVVVALVAVSFGMFRRAVDATVDRQGERQELAEERAARESGVGVAEDLPQYLAFTPGIRSGLHRVAEVEGSRDRDIRPREPAGVDYPVETDIVPQHTLVGGGEPLEPGLYATAFGVENCSYQLRSIMRDRQEAVIGEDRILKGRMLVTVNEIEPDSFSAVPQCGQWAPWSPLTEPLSATGDGDYWSGDLAEGTWSVPVDCMWEKVVGFRGAELFDVQASGWGPDPLVIDEETVGIRIRGCDLPMRLDQ